MKQAAGSFTIQAGGRTLTISRQQPILQTPAIGGHVEDIPSGVPPVRELRPDSCRIRPLGPSVLSDAEIDQVSGGPFGTSLPNAALASERVLETMKSAQPLR